MTLRAGSDSLDKASRPRLLDLFCCAGGAAVGYHRAGFEVIGVDLHPQPNYPFRFIQADALQVLGALRFLHVDAIHASPPCQRYSTMTKRHGREGEHPDLVKPVRDLLAISELPYVIENVPGSPLDSPTTLCGSMFGLGATVGGEYRQLRRHRLFESNVKLSAGDCAHTTTGTIGVYGRPGGSSKRDGIQFAGTAAWSKAMGIDWMTANEMTQAIPPAYTEHIGAQLLAAIDVPVAA